MLEFHAARCIVVLSRIINSGRHELQHQAAAMLRAAIRVVNESRNRALGGRCFHQRTAHQFRRHTLPQRVADEFAGVDVLDIGEIQPALVRGDVGVEGAHFSNLAQVGFGRFAFGEDAAGQRVFGEVGVDAVHDGLRERLLVACVA